MTSEDLPDVLIIGEAHPKDPRPHLGKIKNEKIRNAVRLLLLRAFMGRNLIYREFDEETLAHRWEQIIPLVEKLVQHAAKNGKKVIIHMEALPKGYKKSIVEAMATGDIKHMTAAAYALIRLGDGVFENHVIIRGLKDPKLEEKYRRRVIELTQAREKLAGDVFLYAFVNEKKAKGALEKLKQVVRDFKRIAEKWDKALKENAMKEILEHPDDVHIFIVGEMHRERLENELRKKFGWKKIRSHALISRDEISGHYTL